MKDEIIIDVKEVAHRILKKWKVMIFAAIIGAFLVCAKGYVDSYRNYEKKQPVDEATLEEYKANLSEKELETVEQAYDTYEVYQKQYESELEYNKNSLLMKLGEDNAATVKIQYYIDNHYESVYPVIEQTNNATDIIEAYSLRLTSSDVMNKIKESTGTDVEERYLRELINIEPVENTQTMKITICTNSKELTNNIADVIEQEVTSYTQDIQKQYGNFDVVAANRSETTGIDSTIFELQQKEITSITTLRTQIDAVGNDLNEAQNVYYNALINNAESKKEEFEVQIINKKNIVIGCALGIILVISFIFIKYILQTRLRNKNDLRDIYHSYNFGVVKNAENQKLDNIVGQIVTFSIRGGMKKIGLLGTDNSEDTQEIFSQVASKVKNEKIEVYCACGLEKISRILKDYPDIKQVVIIEKKNGSTYEKIEQEMKICEKCHVEILGNIIIDSE